MDMNKKEKSIATVAAILVGCGVAIGAMATKIYLDKTKEYREEVKRLKKETDFKLSKEFLRELKEELKADKDAKVVVVKDKAEKDEEVSEAVEVEAEEIEIAKDEKTVEEVVEENVIENVAVEVVEEAQV